MKSLLSLGKYWAIEPDTFNNLEALVSKDAPVLENTRTVRIQNGVAIIPVSGVITGRMDFLTYILGGTALDILAKDFRTALENSDVRAIVLDFDSPGGIAVGPAEMADMIFNARGNKPIISYVGRNCCPAYSSFSRSFQSIFSVTVCAIHWTRSSRSGATNDGIFSQGSKAPSA